MSRPKPNNKSLHSFSQPILLWLYALPQWNFFIAHKQHFIASTVS